MSIQDGKFKNMPKEISQKEKPESIFSEPFFPNDSNLIIERILEKYGFRKSQEERMEKFFKSNIPKERKGLFEGSPGYKISYLVRKYAESEISLENLPLLLGERLNIPKEQAKEIAEELEEKLLVFIKPFKERSISKKKSIEKKLPRSISERPKSTPIKDRYRETIE